MQKVDKPQQDTVAIVATPEAPTEALSTAFAIPTAESAIVATEIESKAINALEKQPEPKTPEKVSGLEKLATNNFQVPEYRKYISAEECEKGLTPELHKELAKLLEGHSNRRLIVRSAHPQESEFSGGAFDSVIIDLWKIKNGEQKYLSQTELAEAIMAARKEIVEMAKPENSLQVRRDLKHKEIKDFDPEKMGIYINDLVSSHLQLTIVPLDNGNLSIRFYTGDHETQNLHTFDIPKKGKIEQAMIDKFARHIEYQFRPIEHQTIDRVQKMFEEIQRAQSIFEEPQEMELHLDYGHYHTFVQTKRTKPENTKPDKINRKKFKDGIKTFEYYSPDQTQEPYPHHLFLSKASNRNETRETVALVIDEGKWMESAEIKFPPSFKKAEPSLRNHIVASRMRGCIKSPEIMGKITQQYRELMRLAEENKDYTLIISNMVLSEYSSPDATYIDQILGIRKQLMDCAAVQVRGMSDHDSGITAISHHNMLGSVGPRQIMITYRKGILDTRLTTITGQKLLVMASEKPIDKTSFFRVSLLPLS